MAPLYTIREGVSGDVDALVAFTLQEAREAENIELDVSAVRRGVLMALEDSRLATYWVAETPDGRIVANTSVVTEWSNFHGGHYWWIQSLFVVREHRGGKLVEVLLDHLAKVAEASGALDVRLYAHKLNERALRAYRRYGFTEAPYIIMTRRLRSIDAGRRISHWSSA
jgi:ribosomal protein S18 acetylase RimI-like enzyme